MTPIVIPDVMCACERNDWERRPGTDGDLIACRSCGKIGLVVEQPGTISVHRVTLSLCSLCLTGAGGECHTPGCALWMHRAPDTQIYVDTAPEISSERDALVIAALDEAAADRDERARFARQEGRTDEERGHLDTASQYRAERDRQEAGQPECVITGASWEKPGDCTTHAHRGTSGPPLTHFFGCWRFPEHHGCAVELIQRQSEENAQLIGEKGHLERQLRDHQEVGGEPG